MNYNELEKKAKKLRQDTFLAFIEKGEAHLGGSFSMIETLISLYEIILKKNGEFNKLLDVNNPSKNFNPGSIKALQLLKTPEGKSIWRGVQKTSPKKDNRYA